MGVAEGRTNRGKCQCTSGKHKRKWSINPDCCSPNKRNTSLHEISCFPQNELKIKGKLSWEAITKTYKWQFKIHSLFHGRHLRLGDTKPAWNIFARWYTGVFSLVISRDDNFWSLVTTCWFLTSWGLQRIPAVDIPRGTAKTRPVPTLQIHFVHLGCRASEYLPWRYYQSESTLRHMVPASLRAVMPWSQESNLTCAQTQGFPTVKPVYN